MAVGICPYGQLEEHDEENMLSKYIYTEQHGVTATDKIRSQKWTQNMSLLMW